MCYKLKDYIKHNGKGETLKNYDEEVRNTCYEVRSMVECLVVRTWRAMLVIMNIESYGSE